MTQAEFIVEAQFLIERAEEGGLPLTTIEELLQFSFDEYIEENHPDFWAKVDDDK